jgi:hypothetical protein
MIKRNKTGFLYARHGKQDPKGRNFLSKAFVSKDENPVNL